MSHEAGPTAITFDPPICGPIGIDRLLSAESMIAEFPDQRRMILTGLLDAIHCGPTIANDQKIGERNLRVKEKIEALINSGSVRTLLGLDPDVTEPQMISGVMLMAHHSYSDALLSIRDRALAVETGTVT